MQMTRQQKEGLVEDLTEKIDETPVVGVLDMHSLPARQLQEIKKELVGEADITMARKTLIHLALEESGRENVEALKDNDAVQPALIFTEKNPFSLFKLIQAKKSSAPASGGEVAPSDIVIESGPTDLDPGPMLGRLQQLGAGTSVEDGKIHVENDAVAVEAGDVIDADTAEILNNLGMEPLEVGLDLKLVYEDGEVFGRDVLEIDVGDYRSRVESATSQAWNLAVNAGYTTPETAPAVVRQAVGEARNLAVNAGIVNEEVIDDLLRKAAGQAASVDAELDLAAVDVDEESGADDDAGEEPDETADDDGSDADTAEDAGDEESEEDDASDDDADETDNDVTGNGDETEKED